MPELMRIGLKWGARQVAPFGLRYGAVIALSLLLISLLLEKLETLDLAAIFNVFLTVSPLQWFAAATATAVSFTAIGRYDAVIHRVLNTGVRSHLAARAGVCGIALGQVLGFGVLSGGLVRWRMLSDLSLWSATRISALVGLSFLTAWVCLTTVALLFGPLDIPYRSLALTLAVPLLLALLALIITAPRVTLFGYTLSLPSLRACRAILVWTLIDTAAAALALYILLPSGTDVPFSALFTAYLIALGAGLVSNAPGGLGAFELCLLSLLPHVPPEQLLGAILCFRAVYYALPALLALIGFTFPSKHQNPQSAPHQTRNPVTAAPHIAKAKSAEAGLFFQGEAQLLLPTGPGPAFLTQDLPHHLVALGDPLGVAPSKFGTALTQFSGTARDLAKTPIHYKSGARSAALARQRGQSVLHISDEAVLNPQTFTLAAPTARQLRRHLRKATQAGVNCSQLTGPLPYKALQDIAEGWRGHHGGELGFSMGRFSPNYLIHQRLYTARKGAKILGFISFHEGRYEWTLDLIRLSDTTPHGTAQALICRAIEEAADLGIERLSLAAAPLDPTDASSTLQIAMLKRASPGLRRFKSAFAPVWESRYLIAPGPTALALAGWHIARAIHRPPTLGTDAAPENERLHPRI